MKIGTPMLRGVHFFFCFSCSVALPIPTFSTPPLPECSFCSWADKLALPCCVALVSFCASHARWRCFFEYFQSLCGQNARFCSWADKLALPCCAAFVLSAFLMLGGVAFSCSFNPCACRMFTLAMGFPTGASMLCCVYLFVSHARWFCRFELFNPSMALKLVNLIFEYAQHVDTCSLSVF